MTRPRMHNCMTRPHMLTQLNADLTDLGFAHFFVLSHSRDGCEGVRMLLDNASCLWDSHELPGMDGV